jgi:hypothetical protein
MVLLPTAATAAQEESDLCESMLIPTMESAGLDTVLYGEVLGCQHDVYAGWTMRTVSSTRDGIHDIELNDAGSQLLGQVDTLSMSDTFTYSLRYDRSKSSLYTIGAGGAISTEVITDQAIGSAPNWTNNYVSAYAENMETYLLNNAGTKPGLVEYLQWFMARRDATLQAMSSVQNPMLSAAFLSNWGYMQWPWPWQLADPVTINDFISETDVAIGTGGMDPVILEVQFVQSIGFPATGACVTIYEMVPGSEIVFVCDGDTTDLTPLDGSIQISVTPGSYNVLVNTPPALYTPGPDANGWVVEVTEEGGKYIFYSN